MRGILVIWNTHTHIHQVVGYSIEYRAGVGVQVVGYSIEYRAGVGVPMEAPVLRVVHR